MELEITGINIPDTARNRIYKYLDKEVPLMDEDEIKYIESYLTPNTLMLEYGSGGSTFYFANKVKRLVSVESDIMWYMIAKLKIINKELHNIELLYCPNAKADMYKTYSLIPDVAGYRNYDVILIDGKSASRLTCIETCKKYMSVNTIIFWHDFTKHKKYVLPEYLELIKIVNSMAVVRLKLG